MNDDLIEKMARAHQNALAAAFPNQRNWDELTKPEQVARLTAARAVISLLKEPDVAMDKAGKQVVLECGASITIGEALWIRQAMLDKADG